MTEYVIVGDTELYNGCLVRVCHGDKEFAKTELQKMFISKDEQDIKDVNKYKNLRVEPVEEKDQWWNDRFLMSD